MRPNHIATITDGHGQAFTHWLPSHTVSSISAISATMESTGQNKMSLEMILNNDDRDPRRYHRHETSPCIQRDRPQRVVLPHRPSGVNRAHLYPRPPDIREDTSQGRRVTKSVHTLRDDDMKGPRPPRFRYSEEEAIFCWYHRVDLGMPWDRVAEEFGRRWPHLHRKKSGLQCKFYRLLDDFGVEKVREKSRHGHDHGGPTYTTKVRLVDRVATRYPWMSRQHYNPLPQARYAERPQ